MHCKCCERNATLQNNGVEILHSTQCVWFSVLNNSWIHLCLKYTHTSNVYEVNHSKPNLRGQVVLLTRNITMTHKQPLLSVTAVIFACYKYTRTTGTLFISEHEHKNASPKRTTKKGCFFALWLIKQKANRASIVSVWWGLPHCHRV